MENWIAMFFVCRKSLMIFLIMPKIEMTHPLEEIVSVKTELETSLMVRLKLSSQLAHFPFLEYSSIMVK